MKTMILVIVMICAGLYSSAQERKILDIPKDSPIMKITSYNQNVTYRGLLEGYNPNRLEELFNLDVIWFYKLSSQYDTELKQKVFLESEEGKALREEMKEDKQKIMESNAYFIFHLSPNNGVTKNGEYNLDTKTFDVEFKDIAHYIIPGLISFPSLALKCNPSVKQWKINHPYDYTNTVKIPMTEKMAIEIEENINKLALVVVFKIQGAITQKNYKRVLKRTASKIYFIDKYTNEIYFSL